LGNLLRFFRPARFENRVSRAENLLRAFLWNLTITKPVLDVAARVFRAVELQTLAADQRDRLGFDFSQVARCVLAIGERCLFRMAEHDVTEFVKGRFMRERSNWRDGKGAA